MSTAARERQRLDRFLRAYGSGIGRITRIVGSGSNQSPFSVDVRYHKREYRPEEINEVIIQGDCLIIISATEIIEAQWPGSLPTATSDPRVLRRNDKFVDNDGKTWNVENSEPIKLDDLVRQNVQVRG